MEDCCLIGDDENVIKTEVEDLTQDESYLNHGIEQMEHYKNHLENEIRSMKRELEQLKDLNDGRNEGHYNLSQIQIKLADFKMRLAEHSNELEECQTKLEMYRVKRIECESKVRKSSDDIEQHHYYKRNFIKLRAKRLYQKIKFSECSAENSRDETQQIKEGEKQYSKVRDRLSLKRQTLHIFADKMKKRINQFELFTRPVSPTVCSFLEDSEEILMRDISIYADSSIDFESLTIFDPPKYDIFINYTYEDDFIIARLQRALPQRYSTHVKKNFSSKNIKTCLDNTNTAVIAIINKIYELDPICQADMIHIFKRQFLLVLVISEDGFEPSTNWLNLVWHASTTRKVFLHSSDFETDLRSALLDAQWNLPTNMNISEINYSSTDKRSNRFLGDHHEWTVAYHNPAQVSHNHRQLITDPLRIITDTKLQDFYGNYIRIYFQESALLNLFQRGVNENDIRHFIKGYTHPKTNVSFSETLNQHLSTRVLFYFQPTLYYSVDYQLVKCLIDFVALCIYRQELQPYSFIGTVHRGVLMLEEDLLRYVVGSRIMNTSFLSTSKDKQVAEFFSGKGQQALAVVCTYVIHNTNNRRTALDISTLSCFPHEREVLILPFSAFYVQSVTYPSDCQKPIEMTLAEDDSDILENTDIT